MKICIAGKNDIAVECTDWLLNTGQVDRDTLLICLNRTDRGVDTFQRSLKKYGEENALTVASLEDLYPIENLIFFSVEFDRIIKPDRFASTKLYNIHFSLLPQYKGMYTSAWPLLNGEENSGVTLHRIDAGIDTGDIIDQQAFPIADNDNCRDLYFKYTQQGIGLFKKNFQAVIQGDFQAKPQPARGSSYYAKASIDYANATINLHKTAAEIRNQIRAFSFREYQLPIVHGHRIASAEILDSATRKKPGSNLRHTDASLEIATIDYDLRLMKETSPARG